MFCLQDLLDLLEPIMCWELFSLKAHFKHHLRLWEKKTFWTNMICLLLLNQDSNQGFNISGQDPQFVQINVIPKVSQHTEANVQWQSSRTEWAAAVKKIWIYNSFHGREEEAAKFPTSASCEKKTTTITINKTILREKEKNSYKLN